MIEAEHEDLAVADLAGLGRGGDGFGDFVDLVGGNRDFDLELGQEADGVFGAPIDLGVPLLPAIPFDLGDGQPVHADAGQRVADLVELEWLDDGHDEFHGKNDGFDRGTARTAARLGAQRSTKFAQKMVSARDPEALRRARGTKGRAYRLWLRTGRNRLPPAAELGCSRVRPLIIGPNRKHPKWTRGRDGEGGLLDSAGLQALRLSAAVA